MLGHTRQSYDSGNKIVTYLYLGALKLKVVGYLKELYYVEFLGFNGVSHYVIHSYHAKTLHEVFVILRYHMGA